DRRLDETGARDAAERATSFAKAAPGIHARALAPVEPVQGKYRTPRDQDPIDVPLTEKIALCLSAEEAIENKAVKVTTAFVRAMRERKVLVSSDGTAVDQDLVECGGGIEATAANAELSQIRSYPSQHEGSSAGAGWEYVLGLGLELEAPRIGEQAAALLSAPVCPAATTTVVLDADQMALQVHESTGHPTELDRVYGTEAAYAGTSFLHAGDLGSLRYGSELMNITADPTTPGGLGTFGYDDEGVPAARTAVVEAGEGTLDDLLADVDDGIYLETNKSWSIDDKRLNFQFGTQVAWEINQGKRGRMLRDATYTGVTPVFWGSLDAVGGPEAWVLYGLTNCGKGQPGQHAHVSHGAAPARFRNVQVGVAPS